MAKLDKERLFARIGYEPHEGQLFVHRSNAKRRVVACGVRWGKTTVAVHEALAALLSPTAPSRGWVVSPSFATTNLIVEQVFDLLKKRFPHRIIELNERRRFAAIENLAGHRAEVWAKSAHRPAALLGESLDWVILDEAARMKSEVWNEHLSQRLVDRDGWALIASTPWRNDDWFHDEFKRGQGGEPGYASWTGPTTQNPRISASVVDAEKARHPPEVFFREYGGEFVPDSGRICPTCRWGEIDTPQILTEDDWMKCTTCADCGRPIDAEGKPVGMLRFDGVVTVQVYGRAGDYPEVRYHMDPVLAAGVEAGETSTQ